jgi:hypothetical protein
VYSFTAGTGRRVEKRRQKAAGSGKASRGEGVSGSFYFQKL